MVDYEYNDVCWISMLGIVEPGVGRLGHVDDVNPYAFHVIRKDVN